MSTSGATAGKQPVVQADEIREERRRDYVKEECNVHGRRPWGYDLYDSTPQFYLVLCVTTIMHAGTGRLRSRTSGDNGDSPVTDCDSGRKEEAVAIMLQLMQEINTIFLWTNSKRTCCHRDYSRSSRNLIVNFV